MTGEIKEAKMRANFFFFPVSEKSLGKEKSLKLSIG